MHHRPDFTHAAALPRALHHATLSALLALVAALATGCGGGGEDPASTAAAGSAGGGGPTAAAASTLTVSVANPATHNTSLDLSTASTQGNSARTADGFSPSAYCEVFWENVLGANGKRYALQVYFRQSDKAVLHTSLLDSSGSGAGYSVFHNNSGQPITGVADDAATLTLSFSSKALAGFGTEAGTLNGSVAFPANATTPGCVS